MIYLKDVSLSYLLNEKPLQNTLMTSLYDYVTMAVVYIFVFQSWTEDGNNEYMVIYNLEETNMMEFLSSLEAGTASFNYTIHEYDQKQHVLGISECAEDVLPNSTTVQFLIKNQTKRKYPSYLDVILANKDTSKRFKIVNMPFRKSLFEKIMTSTHDNINTFSLEEIRCIFQKVFFCLDHNEGVAYNICISLQDDQQALTSLFDPNEELRFIEPYYLTKLQENRCNSLIIFSKFKEIVNHTIELYLTYGPIRVARVYGKKKKAMTVGKHIPLKEFNIGFLFECLEVTSGYLFDNANEFYEKFQHDYLNSKLIIFVSSRWPLTSVLTTLTGDMFITPALSWITKLDLWKSGRIERITYRVKPSKPYLKSRTGYYVVPTNNISCASFSIDFVNSVAQPIKDTVVCLRNILDIDVYKVINGIDSLKCGEVELQNDFVFEKDFKSVQLYHCTAKNESAITFQNKYQELKLCQTIGQFYLLGMAGFNSIYLRSSKSKLIFRINYPGNPNICKLTNALVKGTINVDRCIQEITFYDVEVADNISVVVEDRRQTVNISQTTGHLKFSGFLNVELHFNWQTSLLIRPYGNSFSKFSLKQCHITEHIKLTDEFSRIKLSQVKVDDHSGFVINNSCRKLRISECEGIFDLSGPKCFDKIEIDFSLAPTSKFTLKGPIKTNILVLYDIPNSATDISDFFNEFETINHLIISCYELDNSQLFNLEYHLTKRYKIYRLQENIGCESISNSFKQPIESTIRTVRESNQVVDELLTAIFGSYAISKIKGLYYHGILMSNCNCKYLKNLHNLQTFQASLETVRKESFIYLPQSLKVLNIRNSSVASDGQDQIIASCALKNFPNLKALVVDGAFFSDPSHLSFLPHSIDVLVVSYSEFRNERIETNAPELKLSKLYVSALQDMIDSEAQNPNKQLYNFLQKMFDYIDRDYLQSLVFLIYQSQYQLDPSTLCVTRVSHQEFDVNMCTGLVK